MPRNLATDSKGSTPNSAAGLRDLIAMLGRNGVGEVAIERPDGPVVDALLQAGITVVVISPNQVKNLRGRNGSAGTWMTGSTPACSPTPCAPTGPGSHP